MADYNFLIGSHPDHESLKVAVGGSAHGFKFLPVIGKYIVQMLEGNLEPEIQQKWKWRPGAILEQGEANPHPNPLLDLNTLPEWSAQASKAKL